MQDERIAEWMRNVQQRLSERRWRHTLGVAYTSAALTMRYDTDELDAAFTAGLFHDIAKEYSPEETLSLCRQYRVRPTPVEQRNPVLLHGRLGAAIAKGQYGIADEQLLNAIRYHTTGRPGMTLLEKIVFTADYIEPLRQRRIGNLHVIRPLAFSDLDAAIIRITEETMQYLGGRGKEIDDMTMKTHDYYQRLYGGADDGSLHGMDDRTEEEKTEEPESSPAEKSRKEGENRKA